MIPLRRKILLETFKLFDLLVMVFSFALATSVVYYRFDIASFEQFLSMRVKVRNFALFLGFLILWHGIFSLMGLYHSKRLSTRWSEIIDVIKATFLGTVVIFVAAFMLNLTMITPVFLAVFWALTTALTILSRVMLRYGLKWFRLRGRNLRSIVIAGTNPRAVQFVEKIEAKPELGYRIVGFVDEKWPGIDEIHKTGYKVVANFNDFSVFLKDHVVDEVAVILPMKSLYNQASIIVSLCEEQGIIVRVISDIFNLKLGKTEAVQFEDDLMITVSTGAMKGWQVLAKQGLDFFASVILLVIFSPILLVLALLIKVTSPGPAFFSQDRVGLNKRIFRLYKFRTMIHGAEKKILELEHLNEATGPVFKIKEDPRITRLGKFLRKTSIDELPQLINVLKGDMSLVGPRPLPIRDYEGFDENWQRRRFSVRPGITCLWQINGRSEIPFEKWMELDMEYIDKWSLTLDLKILLKTVPVVLRGIGAV